MSFSPLYYAIGLVFGLLTTATAGYLPSRKAGKIDPVEIIRGK
jgi:lipoprotein-releasing system permease protein